MDIAILGFESCLGLAFVGAADMLTLSRRMLTKKDAPELYRVVCVSHDGRPVRDGAGRLLEVDGRFEDADGCAAIIVPGYFCSGDHVLPPTPAIGAAAAWLRRQHALGAVVVGSCNGVFLLGEAGFWTGGAARPPGGGTMNSKAATPAPTRPGAPRSSRTAGS